MPWQLKIDEESKQPVFLDPENDGDLPRPVFINPEGKEIALDPVSMYQKIIDMGKSEKGLRGDIKRLEGQLELFADIEDLSEWKEQADKAIEDVANFKDKDWMDTKKVEKLKSEMKTAHEKQINQMSESFNLKEQDHLKVVQKKDSQIRKLMVSNKFATHPLFAGSNPKTNLPPEIAETYFAKHFKVEEKNGDLELIAYYDGGAENPSDQVYSMENPGEIAGFTEAMYQIFERYPGKDMLLKASQKGSGGKGGTGDDEDGDKDELSKLETEYAAAIEAKDSATAIALKNKIFKLKQKQAQSAA